MIAHPASFPFRALTTLLVPLLLLAGCTNLGPKLETPKLSVVGVELVKGDLMQQRFKARMRVVNPNDRLISVRSVTYTLELGGQEFGRGLSSAAFDIPPLGEAEFDMTVTADIAGGVLRLLDRARSKGMADALRYRLRGEVKLARGFPRTIPFDESGSLGPK